MADDKRGREKQASNADRRQRERALTEARNRGEESEPPAEDLDTGIEDLAAGLATHVYPTTASELEERFGDIEVEAADGTTSVEDLLEPVADGETYESVDEVRRRLHELRNGQ